MSDYWGAIEPAYERVDICGGAENFLNDLSREPVHIRHLLCVHWCDSEICNGGFFQFFENPTGVLAPEAVSGFCEVGRPDLSDIVREAMTRLSAGEFPREQRKRQKLLKPLLRKKPEFEDLEDRYYAVLTGNGVFLDLYDAMAEYTDRHAS